MVRLVRSLSILLAIVLASSVLSGQQPKRKREPYVAPLLPAEQAWKIALPASPSAAAAMDDTTVYVPLEETSREGEDGAVVSVPPVLIALDRETGDTRWTVPGGSRYAPILAHGVVILATSTGIEAIDARTGQSRWSVTLDRPVRTPMIAQGSLLLAIVEGDELIAIDLERHAIAWRSSIGESGPAFMTTDAGAAYVATSAGRVMRVMLTDGSRPWDRRLTGELSAPTVDGDRLFVGSNTTPGSLWALDVRTGENKWVHQGRIFGGAIVGTAAKDDTVYVVSKDNIVRAIDRGSGAQRWHASIATRPILPPRVLEGIVTVVVSSALSTFRADTGAPVSTWAGPSGALLQGPPLIADPAPLRVAIVAVFRDGQVVGLRPTEMLFKEPALTPLTTLPGRALSRER